MKMNDSVSTAVAAQYLGCTQQTIRNLFQQGELTAHYKGRCVMIYRDSLENYKKDDRM